MSKAEDRALEAYPVLFSERNGYDNTFKDRRESYIKGYHQTEKDLELTWEDIETILNVENVLLHECNSRIQLLIEMYPTAKDYYQEILKQFKERTMTQKNKDLLFQDLCARIPYGVIVKYKIQEVEGNIKLGCGNMGYVLQLGNGWWEECKPYLRPMSSMTKEEKKEYDLLTPIVEVVFPCDAYPLIDWLNKKHFDYRGLIPKGLALEASEGMYE